MLTVFTSKSTDLIQRCNFPPLGDEMEDSVISTGETGFLESAQGSHSQAGELSHLIVWQVSTG